MIIETLAELLARKNDRSWIKHTIKIPIKDGISIEKVDYIEECCPLTCKKGFFYNIETGTNLGKSVVRRIYFIINEVELDQPKLIPDIGWREE